MGIDTTTINKLLGDISIFEGTFASDTLPIISKRPCAFIVNTDPANLPGEHWNAILLRNGGKGEFFNSFGLPPIIPNIQNYIRLQCPNGFTFSKFCIQHPESDMCGLYCVDFIRSRVNGESMEHFLGHFTPDLWRNDTILEKRILNYGGG